MSEADNISYELAQRDLNDINLLAKFEPFNRYYLRRLKEIAGRIEGRFRYDPPEAVDKEEREILRRILMELDELQAMLVREKGTCEKQLEAATKEKRETFRVDGEETPRPIPGLRQGCD